MSNSESSFPLEFSIIVDMAVFPQDVVLRACYAFTDRCWHWIESTGDARLMIGFRRKNQKTDIEAIKGDFAAALIDFALRRRIEMETAAIRDVIVTAALAEAGAPPPHQS